VARVSKHEEGVVVQMHDRPCLTDQDYDEVKKVLIQAGREGVRLVVDCSQVQLITGAFISALLVAFKALGARQGDIVLCGMSPPLRQVFEATKMDRVFPICATAEEALRAPWPEPKAVIVVGG
jgi:anti-anti-sigma factor